MYATCLDGGVWHSKKESRTLVLCESDSTCRFDRLNPFAPSDPQPERIMPMTFGPLLSKRMKEPIDGTVGSLRGIATP